MHLYEDPKKNRILCCLNRKTQAGLFSGCGLKLETCPLPYPYLLLQMIEGEMHMVAL